MFFRFGFFGFSLSLLTSSFFLNCAQAQLTVDDLFDKLKSSAIDFEDQGTICEEVERINLEERYSPARFNVVSGIRFQNKLTSQTLGEMDVVVLERGTNNAVFIEEVKCCNPMHQVDCAKNARNQLLKLQTNFHSSIPLSFAFRSGPNPFLTKKNFRNLPESKYGTISVNGAEKYFDATLGYSLSEMRDLRQRLIDCQEKGSCPQPLVKHRKRSGSTTSVSSSSSVGSRTALSSPVNLPMIVQADFPHVASPETLPDTFQLDFQVPRFAGLDVDSGDDSDSEFIGID